MPFRVRLALARLRTPLTRQNDAARPLLPSASPSNPSDRTVLVQWHTVRVRPKNRAPGGAREKRTAPVGGAALALSRSHVVGRFAVIRRVQPLAFLVLGH